MARGRKRKVELTLEQQLESVLNNIAELENKLTELKKTKKFLEKEIQLKDAIELDTLIKSSGKNIDDIKKFLSKK